MDCYFGNGVDDLVVPSDQEPLDRLPSPNSWSRWGVTAPENFKSMTKYFITQTNLIGEEPYFNGKSACEEHSNNSSVYQDSLQQTTSPCESTDYQLNELVETNHADDIFMSSLLEEDPEEMDNVHGSFNFFPDFEYGVLPDDDLLTDMIIQSEYEPRHFYGMGGSKHLKTNAFSTSMDRDHGEVATLHTPHNLRLKDNLPIKTLVEKFASSSESDIMKGHVNEEPSLELSVLHELERVMTQMSEKTRICFRDSLYRLAENSQQHMADDGQNEDLIPEKPPPLIDHDDTLRSENTQTMESETNAIDRAVANLMFSKMDSGARDLAVAEPLKFKQEANGTTGQCNYSLSQSQQPHWPHLTSLAGDAEVPVFI